MVDFPAPSLKTSLVLTCPCSNSGGSTNGGEGSSSSALQMPHPDAPLPLYPYMRQPLSPQAPTYERKQWAHVHIPRVNSCQVYKDRAKHLVRDSVNLPYCCDTDYLFPEHYKIGKVKPPAWNVTDVADTADVADAADMADMADIADAADMAGMSDVVDMVDMADAVDVVKGAWGYGKETLVIL